VNKTTFKIIADITLILVIIGFGIYLNYNIKEITLKPCDVCRESGVTCTAGYENYEEVEERILKERFEKYNVTNKQDLIKAMGGQDGWK